MLPRPLGSTLLLLLPACPSGRHGNGKPHVITFGKTSAVRLFPVPDETEHRIHQGAPLLVDAKVKELLPETVTM